MPSPNDSSTESGTVLTVDESSTNVSDADGTPDAVEVSEAGLEVSEVTAAHYETVETYLDALNSSLLALNFALWIVVGVMLVRFFFERVKA